MAAISRSPPLKTVAYKAMLENAKHSLTWAPMGGAIVALPVRLVMRKVQNTYSPPAPARALGAHQDQEVNSKKING